MFYSERLMYRGFDWDRDGKSVVQGSNDAPYIDLLSQGPRVPGATAQLKEAFAKDTTLARFSICLKPESPENSWPNNLGYDDDYYAKAPPAIGIVSLQAKEFDYKNRIAWVGIGMRDIEHRGKGYGTEVLRWLQKYAFEELGLHKLALQVYENNPGARRCYEKAGFVDEGRWRKNYWQNAQWWDIISMGVLEEEYFERKRAKEIDVNGELITS